MDKCREEFEETFKKLNKISLSDHAVIFGYPKREEAFFNAAWQEQQKRVDELQAKCDQLEMQILRSKFFRVHEYSNQNIERLWREFIKKSHRCIECSNFDVCSCGDELEQALKGGEDQYQETRKHVDNRIKNGAKLTNHRIEL